MPKYTRSYSQIEADVSIVGTTPTLTIGDGGAEDTSLVFDGNAQDYYIGLDDTDDDLKIGRGSAVGTTPQMTFLDDGTIIVTGNIQSVTGSGWRLLDATAVDYHVATICPANGDYNTGLGSNGDDILSIVAGSKRGFTVNGQSTALISTASDVLAVSNTLEGHTGNLAIRTAHEVITLTGAQTASTTLDIPAGSMLLGCSLTVNTAVVTSSATNTWDCDFIGGSTTAIAAAATAGAQNTKIDTLIVPEIASAETNIEFDAPGVETFSSGAIEAVVYYISLTSLANA